MQDDAQNATQNRRFLLRLLHCALSSKRIETSNYQAFSADSARRVMVTLLCIMLIMAAAGILYEIA